MLPRGERNNNIGNIDYRADRQRPGQVGSDGRIVIFDTPEHGVQSAVEVLHVYRDKYGLDTLRGLIGRWAPPNENDTGGYINFMSKQLGVGPDQKLDLNDPALVGKLITAKGTMENGRQAMQRTFTPQVIARGVKAAFEEPSSITGKRAVPTGGNPAPEGMQVASAPGGGGPGHASGGGAAQGAMPQQMFDKIVMAVLTMLFGAEVAQAQPQPSQAAGQETGQLPSPVTPSVPQSAAAQQAPAAARV